MRSLINLLLLFGCFLDTFGQESAAGPTLRFTSKENTRVSIDSFYQYHFQAAGLPGGMVSFSVSDLPAWLNYNVQAHTISGKPPKAGQYPVHITAASGKDTATQRFMLTVYNNRTVNILPLGNSITNGVENCNSYRRDLWQMLHRAGYNFDFIGSWNGHHMGGKVPDPDFDTDHEGHSGWTFSDLFHPPSWDSSRGNINEWLQTYRPDIVLIELGTNDVFQCRKVAEMIQDLSVLTTTLRKKNGAVKIFIAQIPPLGEKWTGKKLCGNNITYHETILQLNRAIAAFTKEHTTKASLIIAVDQYTGIDPVTDQLDDIHPNAAGERKMAARWFEAIRPYLKKL